jgi:hypothetical protein
MYIDDIDFTKIFSFVRRYWREPTFWSTPEGLYNLNLFLQVVFGSWLMHNTVWYLSEVESWLAVVVPAFLYMKFPMYAAIIVNKTQTRFHIGVVAGCFMILTWYSVASALHWRHSSAVAAHKCDEYHKAMSKHNIQISTPTAGMATAKLTSSNVHIVPSHAPFTTTAEEHTKCEPSVMTAMAVEGLLYWAFVLLHATITILSFKYHEHIENNWGAGAGAEVGGRGGAEGYRSGSSMGSEYSRVPQSQSEEGGGGKLAVHYGLSHNFGTTAIETGVALGSGAGGSSKASAQGRQSQIDTAGAVL